MNNRKNRQEQIRNAAKYTNAQNITSFEGGAKWADYHPNWQEGKPKPKENQYGLPIVYLCQVLTLDMTFGYRYTYRIGFINSKNEWSIEIQSPNTKVMRWLEIYANETQDQLIQHDIPLFEEKSKTKEDKENNEVEYNKAA